MPEDIETYLIEKRGNIKRGSIAETMANELMTNRRDGKIGAINTLKPYRSVLDKMAEEIPLLRTVTEVKTRKGSILERSADIFFDSIINATEIIEKKSMEYLSRTRPDIAKMIERKEPFSEIAKQYFKEVK